ncbi:MAG: hypothetical protein LR011_09620 [Verrucomicrobia bacterium]|nr:hypothetical protein [Verrucomicrobiota bacterium]
MKRRSPSWWKIHSALLISMGILFLCGPRVDTDYAPPPGSAPGLPGVEHIEAWLQAQEARLGNVSPIAEKNILWADEMGAKSEWALVYLHGFTATWRETYPLTERVAQSLGANVYRHRFPGHGQPPDELRNITLQQWVESAREAMAIGGILGEKVVVIGCSNGATLSLIALDGAVAGDIHSLILLSPHFQPADPRAGIILWPWGIHLAKLIAGKFQEWEFQNPEDSQYWTSPYPTEALGPVMAAARAAGNLNLAQIRTPCLVLLNPEDKIVNHQRTRSLFSQLGSQPKQWTGLLLDTDPAHHILAGDLRSPETTQIVAEYILQFIRQ